MVTTLLFMALSARAEIAPTLREFRHECVAHRIMLETTLRAPPLIGVVTFLPTGVLERTQSTFSFERMLKAANQAIEDGYLPGIDGRAVYAEERFISGIHYRGKIYIVDGHHRALVSTYFDAQTIPVRTIADWNHLERDEFFRELEDKNMSYFRGLDGKPQPPGEFCDIANDDLLLLARKLLLRVDLEYDESTGHLEILKVRGADTPIGIKINRDVPFLEQEIARLLREAGIKWKKTASLTMQARRKYLKILERHRDETRLRQVLLLDKPKDAVKLDLVSELMKHFERHQCEFQMTTGDGD